jgi:hypothetical protein
MELVYSSPLGISADLTVLTSITPQTKQITAIAIRLLLIFTFPFNLLNISPELPILQNYAKTT